MPEEDSTLALFEIILTAELFNRMPGLDHNDLPPRCRKVFAVNGGGSILRPLVVSDGTLSRALGIESAHTILSANPFVSFETFGQRLKIAAPDAAARWFIKEGGLARVKSNPAIAYHFRGDKELGVDYQAVRNANPRIEDSQGYVEARVAEITAVDDRLKSALDLIVVRAPEEVEREVGDLVLTPAQERILAKIRIALEHRELLLTHRIHEVGKLLFIGPPGTGKTSLALALSHLLHIPTLEVRLSMVTSQYLGETSKNIDRIFDLARHLAPCILFIDEFDYVAKSRTSDDHGAMKRAVNSLLKNIDHVSLVRNNLLLVGATNHPQLLDEAAWRRFDEVVEFSLPDREMRRRILEKVTGTIPCQCDREVLADITDGFSGADLRLMVKEGLLCALLDGRRTVEQEDLFQGIKSVKGREAVRNLHWT
ncbi:MAG: ATP-binding protein [Methanomicrobiales archaeon]|nr:ATP-binding protein [Methanomicrobiales archaeon]